jgi:hypothetical protein
LGRSTPCSRVASSELMSRAGLVGCSPFAVRERVAHAGLLNDSFGLVVLRCLGIPVYGAVRLAPRAVGDPNGVAADLRFLGRWLVAIALLAGGAALAVRYGSATRQALPSVTVGTVPGMAAWAGMSIPFRVLRRQLRPGFRQLATSFVLLLDAYPVEQRVPGRRAGRRVPPGSSGR